MDSPWLEYIIKRYGDDFKFPPYPETFKIDDCIKRKWNYKEINTGKGSPEEIIILPMNQEFELTEGDQFNTVVKKRKKAEIYKGRYRVSQFILEPHNMRGYICYDKPKFGEEIVEEKDMRAGLVYRVEIIFVDYEKRTFTCVPLAHTFDKNNLEDDLINCNYEKYN